MPSTDDTDDTERTKLLSTSVWCRRDLAIPTVKMLSQHTFLEQVKPESSQTQTTIPSPGPQKQLIGVRSAHDTPSKTFSKFPKADASQYGDVSSRSSADYSRNPVDTESSQNHSCKRDRLDDCKMSSDSDVKEVSETVPSSNDESSDGEKSPYQIQPRPERSRKRAAAHEDHTVAPFSEDSPSLSDEEGHYRYAECPHTLCFYERCREHECVCQVCPYEHQKGCCLYTCSTESSLDETFSSDSDSEEQCENHRCSKSQSLAEFDCSCKHSHYSSTGLEEGSKRTSCLKCKCGTWCAKSRTGCRCRKYGRGKVCGTVEVKRKARCEDRKSDLWEDDERRRCKPCICRRLVEKQDECPCHDECK